MSGLVRHQHIQLSYGVWAALACGMIVVACVLALVGNYPKERLHARFEIPAAVSLASTPVKESTKAARYQAIKENWKRYRSELKVASK